MSFQSWSLFLFHHIYFFGTMHLVLLFAPQGARGGPTFSAGSVRPVHLLFTFIQWRTFVCFCLWWHIMESLVRCFSGVPNGSPWPFPFVFIFLALMYSHSPNCLKCCGWYIGAMGDDYCCHILHFHLQVSMLVVVTSTPASSRPTPFTWNKLFELQQQNVFFLVQTWNMWTFMTN